MENPPLSVIPLGLLDGKYQLLRQLGEGGMGAVFEARHTGTGRRVAVKVIASEALAKSADIVGRFRNEAMASGAIESQYIANVMDTGIDPETGSPYMVMELLVGEDLEQAQKRLGPLAPEVALRVAAQACLGLSKAHEAGVIHRDIKPANLYLTKRDGGEIIVKLVDFGIAKMKADSLTSTENKSMTRTGSMVGSPVYMSPEQAFGKKNIDQRTDIWSLGVVLYEALTGTTPHGDAETVGALLVRICSIPSRVVQERAPWVTPDVAALVHRCLALDPDARFQTAAEMHAAIKGVLPGPHALDDTMFVPLSEAVKSGRAPRLSLPDAVRQQRASSADLSHLMANSERAPSGNTLATASTTGGVGVSEENDPVVLPQKKSPLVAIVGAVMVAAVGIGGWAVATHSSSSAAAAAPAVLVAPPTWTPPASAAEPPPAVAPVPADRTVRVVVLPAGVAVTVDGVTSAVSDGTVPLKGSLGSTHKVKIASGGRDKEVSVVIAQDGPVPPMIDLGPAPVKAAPAHVAAAPAAAPPPPPKSSNPLEMQMQ